MQTRRGRCLEANDIRISSYFKKCTSWKHRMRPRTNSRPTNRRNDREDDWMITGWCRAVMIDSEPSIWGDLRQAHSGEWSDRAQVIGPGPPVWIQYALLFIIKSYRKYRIQHATLGGFHARVTRVKIGKPHWITWGRYWRVVDAWKTRVRRASFSKEWIHTF